MRVALVHYHLQSGGVTRIVCHLQRALAERGIRTVALIGKPPAVADVGPYRVIPGLQYEGDRPAIDPASLADSLRREATTALGGPPDLWHVHNHSLGKSLVLPLALHHLASQGQRILFQVHDFAEDGRPANYRSMLAVMAGGCRRTLARLLYPQADHLHYLVLNRRDHAFLLDAGLDPAHLHLQPNPIDFGKSIDTLMSPPKGSERLWLYPTRAIRRKNLGEFLLWSLLAPEEVVFATTSGPENPMEQGRYRRWRQVAAELRLPVRFEVVQPGGESFVQVLRRAEVAVTTSVAEGFGMAFLEPWFLGTPVWGRNLPEISPAVDERGVTLLQTYDRLEVPLVWLGRESIELAIGEGLRRNLAAYGRHPAGEDFERARDAWIRGDQVDFGRLHEPLQEQVLRHLAAAPSQAAQVRPGRLPDPATLAGALPGNQEVLRRQYTLEGFGQAIEAIYQRVLAVSAGRLGRLGRLDGEVLLDRFLAPERLFLLRVD